MSKGYLKQSPGYLIKETLAGSWRCSPPALEISAEELEAVAPLLIGSGTAALAWWRLRSSDLRFTPEAEELERAFHLNIIQGSFYEQQVEKIFGLFRRAGIEAILVKGWAVARIYPDKSLRPCGDIDLIIRPDQVKAAQVVLSNLEGNQFYVDYEHEEFGGLDRQGWYEFYALSGAARLGKEQARLMSSEDHLRFLCIHLLRHGAWRPLWLCDVAAVMEFRPDDFDWDRCLGKDKRQADWVACALGLAHQLLGARVSNTPVHRRAKELPNWLIAAVLKQWEKPRIIDRLAPELIMTSLRHPTGVVKALRNRWPDPIQATIRMKGPINKWPRLPFQVGEYMAKTTHFMTRLPRLLREQE